VIDEVAVISDVGTALCICRFIDEKCGFGKCFCMLSPFITDDMVSKVMLDICLYVSNFQPSMYIAKAIALI